MRGPLSWDAYVEWSEAELGKRVFCHVFAMLIRAGSGPGAQSSKNAEAAKTDGAVNRLNVNASYFRPNPKGLVLTRNFLSLPSW
jgi:hypothetical protein